jgi:YVTN family beta-propeller protein
VAITPNGAYAYVTNNGIGSDSVSVISTATNTVTATVTVGSYPWGVAITPNGEYAYATNYGSDTVSVISTATTASPSPTIPEFPAQLLIVALAVFVSIVLSAVIVAKKRKRAGKVYGNSC